MILPGYSQIYIAVNVNVNSFSFLIVMYDFIVEFKDRNGSTVTVSDDINVKISEKN